MISAALLAIKEKKSIHEAAPQLNYLISGKFLVPVSLPVFVRFLAHIDQIRPETSRRSERSSSSGRRHSESTLMRSSDSRLFSHHVFYHWWKFRSSSLTDWPHQTCTNWVGWHGSRRRRTSCAEAVWIEKGFSRFTFAFLGLQPQVHLSIFWTSATGSLEHFLDLCCTSLSPLPLRFSFLQFICWGPWSGHWSMQGAKEQSELSIIPTQIQYVISSCRAWIPVAAGFYHHD
jgi:hypothetical protein